MNIMRIFQPKPTLSDQEVAYGLRMMTWEGVVSMGFTSIATGGLLAAFALALGANNFQIGILAAIPFITQLLQIPAILLVERFKKRKLIAVVTWSLAQLLWFPIALIPFFIGTPSAGAISVLLGLMALRGVLHAIQSCNWNPWIRDLVPRQIMGRFFSRRLAWATIVGVIFGLGAAFFVDYWRGQVPSESAIFGYTYAFLFGALFLGLASPVFMSLIPEPLMQAATGPQPTLWQTVTTPLRDKNFRQLMKFLLFWGFASNLAIPFFAVYMLQRLGLPLTAVIGFSVISQFFNILFLRVWGPLVDRFGSKVVLSLCASLYLLVILGWTFTTMPERYFLTIPLLIILHVFAGIATAGVALAVGTIGLKLAPQGQATSYLAGASLAINLGAGLGPILGGLFAHFFSVRELALDFTWLDPSRTIKLGIINLTGFDFLFVVAFIIGLITLNTLTTLREEGEAGREVVLGELMTQTRTVSLAVSSVPGLNFVSMFPFSYLRRVPGIDVAIGVTAHQLADIAKMTTLAVARGKKATSRLATALEKNLPKVWKSKEEVPTLGVDIARHTVRGVLHAVREVTMQNAERLVRPAVVSIVRTLNRAQANPQDAFRGAGYGTVQGAAEAGVDLGKAVTQAIAGAREATRTLSSAEQEAAVAQVVEGALAAAEAIGPEAVAQVKNALSVELSRNSHRESEHRADTV